MPAADGQLSGSGSSRASPHVRPRRARGTLGEKDQLRMADERPPCAARQRDAPARQRGHSKGVTTRRELVG